MFQELEEARDRRQGIRLPMEITALAEEMENRGDNRLMSVKSRDVSYTGAFFNCRVPFGLGSIVKLIMYLGNMIVEAFAKVVRVEAEGMAVHFTRTTVVPVA